MTKIGMTAAVIGMSLGLAGCLDLGRPAGPRVSASAPALSDDEVSDDLDADPARPPRPRRAERGGIDPLRTLERPRATAGGAPAARPAGPAPQAPGRSTLAAAGPASEGTAGIPAGVEAARVLHERNAEEQRRRDRDVELRNRRITDAICSRC